MGPKFFKSANEFRHWLTKNFETKTELSVGFYKVKSGKASMTWPESVDQALCFGWIDGVRRSHDADSYTIRFTPRTKSSTWSNVNIRRAEELIQLGLMQPAGLKAYEARKENKSGTYSYEQRSVELIEPYQGMLKKNRIAWTFFESQPATYRKAVSWWIISAKQEATRLRRLDILIACSLNGQRIPQFVSSRKSK